MPLTVLLLENNARLREELSLALTVVGGYKVINAVPDHPFNKGKEADIILVNAALLGHKQWPLHTISYHQQGSTQRHAPHHFHLEAIPAIAEHVRRIYGSMTHISQDFNAITDFIYEIEKLKSVERRIKIKGTSRYENSAEHSWHIALLALSLMPYAEKPVEAQRVVTMLLIHDLVEIDTGDKFAYDANHDDYANEHAAAKRIFGLLPPHLGTTFLTLWEEFEAAETDDAQYAKAIDRLMPVLQNLNNGCQSWLEHDISIEQVLKKNAGVAKASQALWDMVVTKVEQTAKAAGVREK